jgi:hypothetical protein
MAKKARRPQITRPRVKNRVMLYLDDLLEARLRQYGMREDLSVAGAGRRLLRLALDLVEGKSR